MATKALAYFFTTMTQGGADAFVQNTINTGLTGQTKTAFQIAEFQIEMTDGLVIAADYELSFTRKSFAAAPTLAEKSLIAKFRWGSKMTTSGAIFGERVRRVQYSAEEGPIIVEDPIYCQLDSTASSAANTMYVRIGYRTISLTEVERLQLIANSLQQ